MPGLSFNDVVASAVLRKWEADKQTDRQTADTEGLTGRHARDRWGGARERGCGGCLWMHMCTHTYTPVHTIWEQGPVKGGKWG